MAYIKTNWKDQKVERPKTYELQENSDGTYTLLDRFGQTDELGTPVNALNMNHIEEGIDACALRKYNPKETFKFKEAVLGEVDGELIVCRSLQDENIGHELTEKEYWQKINISFIPPADSATLGGIKTDEVTTQTDKNGVLSVNTDFVNQSKALETGNVSSVPEVYEDIYKYAHSSFDLSKFTVGGSPIISDDGIASGFSSDSYLTIENVGEKLKQSKNWKIEFPVIFKDGTATTRQEILGGRNATNPYPLFIRLWQDGILKVFTEGITGDVGSTLCLNSKATVQANKEYLIKVFVENNVLYFYLNGELQDSHTISENIYFNDIISVGVARPGHAINVFQGSIDFKQFSITADGVEVFSGNNTSVDIIKPDNYTVVGNPTISTDGIASGFSDTNYITVPTIKFSTAKTWEIDFSFKTPKEFNYGSAKGMGVYGKEALMKLDIRSSLDLSWCFSGANFNWAAHSSVKKVEADTLYFGKAYFNGTSYKLDLSTDGATYTNWITYNNANSIFDTELGIGNNINKVVAEISFQGSIDLNSFRIYKDEKLIYQPCLKIPYTLSKTGSKIVDARYRDRVQDMYEQFGYAPYYTIDEENKTFTLPMGEIYGMIEKNRQNLDDILRPIGKPLISMNNDTLNFDEIWLEGDKVLKSTYPKLTTIYGDDYAPLEAEDTDTYLYLPDCRKRTAWGSPDGSYGYIEAGLPNITGQAKFCAWRTTGASGALGDTAYNNAEWQQGGTGSSAPAVYPGANMVLDASRSNPIYSNSDTVQTPSFKVRWKTRFK